MQGPSVSKAHLYAMTTCAYGHLCIRAPYMQRLPIVKALKGHPYVRTTCNEGSPLILCRSHFHSGHTPVSRCESICMASRYNPVKRILFGDVEYLALPDEKTMLILELAEQL